MYNRLIRIFGFILLAAAISGSACFEDTPEVEQEPFNPEINLRAGIVEIASGGNFPFPNTALMGSSSEIFIIENLGRKYLRLTGEPIVSVTGTDASMFTVVMQPSTPLAPFTYKSFTLIFAPTGGAVHKSAVVTIKSNDPAKGTFSFTVEGDVPLPVSAPDISVEYLSAAVSIGSEVDLGSVTAGSTADYEIFINNTGDADLTLSLPVLVSGVDASKFSVVTPPAAVVTHPAGDTSFILQFTPGLIPGERTAQITISSNDADESLYTFTVKAEATPLSAPKMSIRQGSTLLPAGTGEYDFGAVNQDTDSAAVTFTIYNTGDLELNLNGVPVVNITGTDPTLFDVTIMPASPVAATIGTSTFTIVFRPDSAGPKNAVVSIGNDSSVNPFTFNLTGTGVAVPEINIQEPPGWTPVVSGGYNYDFGSLVTVDPPGQVTFRIYNSGSGPLNLLGDGLVSITGDSQFTLSASPSAVIAAAGFTSFTLDYDPVTAGSHEGLVTILSNDINLSAFTFTVSGTTSDTAVPEIQVRQGVNILTSSSPAAVDFGGMNVGGTPLDVQFSIRNIGSAPLTFGPPAIGGADSDMRDMYAIISAPVSPVAPGGTANFTVRFTATSQGDKIADITITSNDAVHSPFKINLQGRGMTPEINLQQNGTDFGNGNTYSFGARTTGSVNDVTFVIQNTGADPLYLTGTPDKVAVLVSNPDFAIISQPSKTSLGTGESTYFTVRYTPTSVAPDNATFTIANNDQNENPYTVIVTGSGTPVSVLAVTSTSLDGHYMQAGNINVTVYFSGKVTLSGNTLIANLNSGGSVAIAPFGPANSAAGTYTVGPGQNSPDLAVTGLTLSGGAVLVDAAVITPVLTVPGGSNISDFRNIVVDTTPPTATITYSVPGPYKAGDAVIITATFNEAVKDTPVPQISISGANIFGPVNMTQNSATEYTYDYTVAAGNGTATITMSTAQDLAGNGVTAAPTSGADFTVDNTPPTAAISYSAAGPYKSGDFVTITATFNEAVKDSPVPQISINGANTFGPVNMTQSSATEYTYGYTVAAGDGTATISMSTAQDLAGNGVTAAPTSGADFTVDNTPPTAAISYSAAGPYKSGDLVTITATFNEAVEDSPVPQISINGANTLGAVDMTKSSATEYTYDYTVAAGDGTATVAMATAQDLAGNGVTAVPTSGADFTVDSTPPTAAITYSAAGPYKSGDAVTITATFNEAVKDSPVPQISINGANILGAVDMTKSSATEYTYGYTVAAGNGTATITMSTAQDLAGNVVVSAPTSGADFTVDNTPPTAAISYSAAGPYKSGDLVTITATFNEAVEDSPVPQISINGANILGAVDMTKSSATEYTYDYTVAAGDGTATVAMATAQDLAGNVVVSAPTSGADFTVDNTPPTAAISYSAAGPYKSGDAVTITATFNEAVKDSPVPQISINGANILGAVDMAKSSATEYTYDYTVAAGDGTATVAMATAQDLAGNVVVSAPTSGADFTVDNTPPTAAISYSAAGPYKSGDLVTITATFNEAVEDSPVPQISINGANTLGAVDMTKSSATEYTYDYTVAAGDGTATVAMATAQDLAGNGVTAAPTSGADFTVDNTQPQINSITSTTLNGSYKAGETVDITVTLSEPVTLDSGTLDVTLDTFDVISVSSVVYPSDVLTGTYTIAAGDISALLDSTGIALNGGATLRDAAGNDANIVLPAVVISTGSTIAVDTTAPEVDSVTLPLDDTYFFGDPMVFIVVFNEDIFVTGADSVISIDIGGVPREAAQTGLSGSTGIIYTYIVQAGDVDPDGIFIDAGSLVVNTTVIADAADNTAIPDLNGIGTLTDILVDSP